jgi:hypothetical protein
MTLMTNDLNDHHDRMVVVEAFLFYDKKKQSLTLSRVPGFYIFNNLNQLATILSRVKLTTFISHNGKMRNSFFVKPFTYPKPQHSHRVRQQNYHQG